jgi:hypothetical protein
MPAKSKNTKKGRITIRMTDEMLSKLEVRAASKNVTVGEVVRLAVEKYFVPALAVVKP